MIYYLGGMHDGTMLSVECIGNISLTSCRSPGRGCFEEKNCLQ